MGSHMNKINTVELNGEILKSSKAMLKFRIVYYIAVVLQLIYVAIHTLGLDLASSPDPIVRQYDRVRWKLITCWFNLIMGVHGIMAAYCDWKEYKDEADDPWVQKLQKYRNITMTSILVPTTVYSDTFFWRLFCMDVRLIAPPAAFVYVSYTMQHVLHTLSLFHVVLDLFVVPRRRPKDMFSRWVYMFVFLSVYTFLGLFSYYVEKEPVYPYMTEIDARGYFDVFILCLWPYFEMALYFDLQWRLVDYLWGVEGQKKIN